MKISIIGAGIGGLSAACLLAAKGHEVEVFEKNDRVGGKMNIVEAEEFRFDTGPSLLTMPHLLEKLFEECGESIKDHLKLVPLSPVCRYNYQDGVTFDCFDNREATIQEIAKISNKDAKAYSKFLDYSEQIYGKTADAFIYNPLFDLSDFKKLNLLSFFGIDAFSTVSKSVDRFFESSQVRKFFKRFTTYNGSSPFLAPATLNVIPHVELNQGGYYVDGGLHKIAESLFWLATRLRVHFHFNSLIEKIVTSKKAVTELIVNGESKSTDLVFANSDATETISTLLDEGYSESKKNKASKIEASCSGFVLLLGINRTYDQLVHHNIFFSDDYENEFKQIFERKVMPTDPTIYVANTSYSNPEHAIEGGSNLFILVNAPYLSNEFDWKDKADDYEQLVVSALENRGLTDLSKHILFKDRISPEDFYRKYLSNRGSIYGTSSNTKFSAFVRPRNKSKVVDGLYFVGGSTHPGGGIPLVIQSAFNAVELFERYERG